MAIIIKNKELQSELGIVSAAQTCIDKLDLYTLW